MADAAPDAGAEERTREMLNTGTKEVAETHKFDEAALDRWLRANVADYAGPLQVRQFKGGQSNPTYQLITRYSRSTAWAAGQAIAVGPRRRSRVPGDHRPLPDRLPGSEELRSLHGRCRHRHLVLRYGHGRGPDHLGPGAADVLAGPTPPYLHGA